MSPSTSSPAGWKRGQSRPELRSRGERGAEHLPRAAEAQPDTGQTRPGSEAGVRHSELPSPGSPGPGTGTIPAPAPSASIPPRSRSSRCPAQPGPSGAAAVSVEMHLPSRARAARAGGFHGDAGSSPAQPEPGMLPRGRSGTLAPHRGRSGLWVPGALRGCACAVLTAPHSGDSAGTAGPAALNVLRELSPPSRAGPPRSGCAVTSRVPKGRQVSLCLYPAPGEERRGGNPRVPR